MTSENSKQIDELFDRIHHLLDQVGDLSTCKGCGVKIYWAKHKNGKNAPYTPAGSNHFIDCPKAQEFKTGKERK